MNTDNYFNNEENRAKLQIGMETYIKRREEIEQINKKFDDFFDREKKTKEELEKINTWSLSKKEKIQNSFCKLNENINKEFDELHIMVHMMENKCEDLKRSLNMFKWKYHYGCCFDEDLFDFED